MGQKHTWNFYLTAGRTWGGPTISGATITAYSSKTGSSVLQTLTTNASGYTTYTLSGSSYIASPTSYYWRVNLGNTFGSYYNGQKIIGKGDTSGYYGTPGAIWNTEGVAIMDSYFNTTNINSVGTVTVYLFAAGNNITINSNKFLTHFDLIALVPPSINFLPARPSTWLYNQCITGSELEDYDRYGAFLDSQFGSDSDLVRRGDIQEYSSFLPGTSATPSLSTTSLAFTYADSTASTKTVTVTVPSGFAVGSSITGTSSSYFKASISQTDTKTFHITVYPTNTNYTTSARVATLVVSISKIDTDAWFGGSITSATVAITQGCYNSGGSSGSTGGGTTGGGSQT